MKFLYGFLPSMNKTTCAVLSLAHVAEISEICRLLGHASTGVTERVYAEFWGFCIIPWIKMLNYPSISTKLS